MKKTILLLIICLSTFSGCEKDDICAADTPTTPTVVIEFFDNASTNSKAVTKLEIREIGNSKSLGTFGEPKIKLPLKTDDDVVKYSFTLNSDKAAPIINTDILEFNYTRKIVYISRACGYKTIFVLNANSPTKTDIIPTDTFWIKKITIVQPNINDENETHIKIFF